MNTSHKIYKTLLKDVELKSYGANLSNIIKLERKDMPPKKLLVMYDGEMQEPISYEELSFEMTNEGILLKIESASRERDTQKVQDVPQEQPIADPVQEENFSLQGDDLESFQSMSPFRQTENKTEKGDTKQAITISSGTFDITDINCIMNAILDLVNAEQKYIDEGYKILQCSDPKFSYEDNKYFKLIESAVLSKEKK